MNGTDGKFHKRHLIWIVPLALLAAVILEIVIYGSEDGVLNRDLVAKGRTMAPARYVEHVIAGGNHAQFGSYGAQSGDGAASVTPEEQRAETVRVIMEALGSGA